MAITKLSELQAAIGDRLARSDFTAAQQLECINFAEMRMMRELEAWDQETKNASFTIDSQYETAPTAMAGVRTFLVTSGGNSWVIQESSPEAIVTKFGANTGAPQEFAVVGTDFLFGPTPDAAYTATLVYYAPITPLASANDTNWILQKHADAYLYGSLMEAGIRLQNQELTVAYGTLFEKALADINRRSRKRRWTGPAMAQRPA